MGIDWILDLQNTLFHGHFGFLKAPEHRIFLKRSYSNHPFSGAFAVSFRDGKYLLDLSPNQDASHHQDSYIFFRRMITPSRVSSFLGGGVGKTGGVCANIQWMKKPRGWIMTFMTCGVDLPLIQKCFGWGVCAWQYELSVRMDLPRSFEVLALATLKNQSFFC